MHPFSTPWKHQKTLWFSDVFKGYRKGALGTNGLSKLEVKARSCALPTFNNNKLLILSLLFYLKIIPMFRSSYSQMLCKIVVFKNFAKFWSHFLTKCRQATLFKRRHQHRCLAGNFVKFLRNLFYKIPPKDCF